jgi:hypothetical protein
VNGIGEFFMTWLNLRANWWIVLLSPCLTGLGLRVSLLAIFLLNLLTVSLDPHRYTLVII